jgi:hypothetical protein
MRVVLFHAIQRSTSEITTNYLDFCRQAAQMIVPLVVV